MEKIVKNSIFPQKDLICGICSVIDQTNRIRGSFSGTKKKSFGIRKRNRKYQKENRKEREKQSR